MSVKKPRKPPKDKNAPKKNLTSYLIFTNERRPILMGLKEHKDKKITEISKIIAVEWKNLTDDEKKLYENKSLIDKERYKNELQEYQKTELYQEYQRKLKLFNEEQSLTKESKNNKNSNSKSSPNKIVKENNKKKIKLKLPKKPIDNNLPQKPCTPYIMFSNEKRIFYQNLFKSENKKFKLKDIQAKISNDWKLLSTEEKNAYKQKYNDSHLEYKKVLSEYKNTDEHKQFELKLKDWKTKCHKLKKNIKNNDNDGNRDSDSSSWCGSSSSD